MDSAGTVMRQKKARLLALGLPLLLAGCIAMDSFLFASEPLSVEDYDFADPELDGIDPRRITSELVPVGDSQEHIHVLFVERDESKLDPRIAPYHGVTVLFSHGNRQNMKLYWYRAGYFEDMGFHVLMYDYRGYGASSGQTSESNVYEDARTAFDYLRHREDVGIIISVGHSMGGGPAIWLCSPESEREVAACFTESAFASTAQVIQSGTNFDMPSSWFMDTVFDNETRIGTVTIPYLLMHGVEDQRVAFENGRVLWGIVEDQNPVNRFYAVEGAGHRNVSVPAYPGEDEPRQYSHPDELPPELRPGYEQYRDRIEGFVVDVLRWR